MRSTAFEHGEHGCGCEKVARLTEILPMAVWVVSSDGSLAYANRAARALPKEARDTASFVNGERMRFLSVTGAEVLVLRENGERSCIGATSVLLAPEILRLVYGLSPAETRVAVSLAGGRTPRQVAREFQLSLHTVRSHIKSLFGKTQTRCQNELVARLVTGIATLRLDDAAFTQLGDSATETGR